MLSRGFSQKHTFQAIDAARFLQVRLRANAAAGLDCFQWQKAPNWRLPEPAIGSVRQGVRPGTIVSPRPERGWAQPEAFYSVHAQKYVKRLQLSNLGFD